MRIWQVADGGLLRSVGCCRNDYIRAVAFSSDSRWIAAGRDGGHLQILGVVDGADGGGTEEPAHRGIKSIAFSPTMKLLATGGGEGNAKLWDYTDGLSDETLLRTFSEHRGAVNAVAFLPSGLEVVSVGDDGRIIIRRLNDGFVRLVLQDAGAVVSVAVSADGKTMLTASADIKFWRISDGSLLQTFNQEVDNVTSLATSQDGRFFAYSRGDGAVVLARVPLWIESITQADGKTTLRWQGGSGVYRVQARPHLDKGDWHSLGSPTTNTTFTHSSHSGLFYRVQSLPNP